MDCTNKESIWKSDKEIKIDKLGYIIEDGKKTKNFCDAKISCNKEPLRLKVWNIAGDEIIISLTEEKKERKKEKEMELKNKRAVGFVLLSSGNRKRWICELFYFIF